MSHVKKSWVCECGRPFKNGKCCPRCAKIEARLKAEYNRQTAGRRTTEVAETYRVLTSLAPFAC